MDPLGMTPEQYTAGAAWATFFVLLGAAGVAWRQVIEARKLRQIQMRPYVVLAIEVEQMTIFMLTVANVGRTPAFNVRVGFDETPVSSIRGLEDVQMLRTPIPALPPGSKHRAYWELSRVVFDEEEPYPHPTTYPAWVTYQDHEGTTYGPEPYVLDFNAYKGLAAGPKGINELVKAVDDLRKEHKKWTDYPPRGLRVNATHPVKKERRDARPWHFRKAKQAYKEEGCKGAALYWIDIWRRRYGLWSK